VTRVARPSLGSTGRRPPRATKGVEGPLSRGYPGHVAEAAPAPAPSVHVGAGGATVRVGRRDLNLSNVNKVLYREAGFTKGDVINYYLRVSETILRHLRNRTVTLKRYPNGPDGMFFYEKNCPAHRPPWVDTKNVPSANRTGGINYCLINDAPTLIWVANLAALELHTQLSLAKDVTRPTMMVFDLDPGPPAGIIDCCRIAVRMRDTLEGLGLKSFPKTSGGKGLHFYVPLNTPCTFDQTKDFARTLAMVLEKEDPAHVVSAMRKDLRVGKVFIDWSQNDEHKTTVCAYSLRARSRPTVSTPVTWDEVEAALEKNDPNQLTFEWSDVLKRVEKHGDLFDPVLTLKQKLPK